MSEPGQPGQPGQPNTAMEVLDGADGSLLELVDHLLNQGVVLTGDVVLGLAGVDLIYARLSLLLCAADRILPKADRE